MLAARSYIALPHPGKSPHSAWGRQSDSTLHPWPLGFGETGTKGIANRSFFFATSTSTPRKD